MFKKSKVIYILEKKTRASALLDILPENLKKNLFGETLDFNKNKPLEFFLKSLPIKTIFSKTVSLENSSYNISIPFFSSHIKVPVKIGETVWLYIQDKRSRYDIDSYWLSRVHGLNFSEDVNYTYSYRDEIFDKEILNIQPVGNKVKSRQERKDYLDRNKNAVVFEVNSLDNIDNNLLESEANFLSQSLKKYPIRCVPLNQGHSDDLILQGSNNTQIKLTTDEYYNGQIQKNTAGKGEITISAGSGQFESGVNAQTVTGNIFNRNSEIQDIFHVMTSTQSDTYPVKIKINNKEENFKNPEIFYLNKTVDVFKGNEGAFAFLSDASKIAVSEAFNPDDSFLRSFSTTYNSDNDNEVYFSVTKTSNLIDLQKKQNNNEKERKNDKYTNRFSKRSENIRSTSKKTPTISLSSSNINIFSRKSDGGIKLIKEYYSDVFSKDMSALIRIDNKGDAFIDANRIFIGNYRYFKEKKLLSGGDVNEKNFSLIHLGDSENSEPLVLGSQLKKYILEIVNVNRQDMHDTKNLFFKTKDAMFDLNKNYLDVLEEKIDNSTLDVQVSLGFVLTKASAVPSVGAALAPVFEETINAIQKVNENLKDAILEIKKLNKETLENFDKEIIKIKSMKNEINSKRLEAIEDNVDKILSKISKTS